MTLKVVTASPTKRARLPRTLTRMFALTAVALTLASCSHRTATEQTPVSLPTSITPASASKPATTAPSAQTSCGANGTTIPSGTYTGSINATLTTTMRLDLRGASIPSAGGGTESLRGTVTITSADGQVTGTITLSGLGLSQVGLPTQATVNTVDDGDLTAKISGPAVNPVVDGTLSGEWASLDAPVINGSGSATSAAHAGLHITRAHCSSITGDAVAMFAEFVAPVAQYLSVSGSGTWTATRT